MKNTRWFMPILLALALCLILPAVASADTLTTYVLQGLDLSDGGSITGQFTYDSTSQAINNGYSNIQIFVLDPNNFGPVGPIPQSLNTGSSATQLNLIGSYETVALTFGTSLNSAPSSDPIVAASFPSGVFDVTPTIALGTANAPEINAGAAPSALFLVACAVLMIRGRRKLPLPTA
jgi:hypothetical protein